MQRCEKCGKFKQVLTRALTEKIYKYTGKHITYKCADEYLDYELKEWCHE